MVKQHFQFPVDGGSERLVSGVLRALRRHIEPTLIDDIREELPEDIGELFDTAA